MKKKILGFGLIFLTSFSMARGASPTKEMQEVLTALEEKKGKPIEKLDPHEAREQPTPTDAVRTVMQKKDILDVSDLAEVKTIQLDGGQGKILARVYIPKGKGPFPVVVYFHGGGWVIADSIEYDATPRSLAQKTNAIFVAPEYRRAPEYKFPAAHEDAFASYQWVVQNAASLNGDPKRVAVAGESAGGNLALNVAIKARDIGLRMPEHQLLIYPVVGTDMNTASYIEHGKARPLNKPMMNWFMKQYLTNPSEREDPRINLLKADFMALSPTTIIAAQIDPLRSEGELLAEKLKKQGVEVNYKNYEGVTHEFFRMSPVVKEAVQAQEEASEVLRKTFKQ